MVNFSHESHEAQPYFYKILSNLHDQNKSGFFGGPAFIQPIRAILKVFKKS